MDFDLKATAIASLGPAVALVARDHHATGNELTTLSARFVALATPSEASVIVSSRPDVAAATRAQGVLLRAGDLEPKVARAALPTGWLGRSVHTLYAAEHAIEEGADYLVLGNIWETATHPDRPGCGLGLLEVVAGLGTPVIAIGGVTVHRAPQCREAGAWGVGAISALWSDRDPVGRAVELAGAFLPTT